MLILSKKRELTAYDRRHFSFTFVEELISKLFQIHMFLNEFDRTTCSIRQTG